MTLSCLPGLVQIGPNLSMCMENGEWEPDLRTVQCISNESKICALLVSFQNGFYDCVLAGATEADVNGQQPFILSQNGKIAFVSVIVFIVTFIITFVIGFICGHLCGKQRKAVPLPSAPEKRQTSPSDPDPALDLNQEQKTYENALELQENASYASIK